MKRVAAIFAKLWAWISSPFAKDDGHDLDVSTITQRFNLLEEARKLAELGLPAYHSKTLSSIELEVVRYIEGAREQIKRETLADLERMDNVIGQTQVHQYDAQSSAATADFERKALLVFNEQNAWLDKLGAAAKRRMTELDKFRAKHHLDRDAIYPDSSGLFFRYALLVLLVTFEGVVNASFFAEGLSTGLIGGFFYAIVLAGINVFTSFLMGKAAVRWVFHASGPLRAFGAAMLVLTLAFTATMALAIGHLRAAILLESNAPTQDAWYALMTNPLGLNDLVAWGLFLVTIGFGIASMIDGLFVDDLYPGYGDVTRRAKLAVDEFEEEFEQVRESLEDIKQESLDALDAELVRANQLAALFKQQLDDKKAIYQSWMKTIEESEVALYACLRLFRSENSRHRNDALRPPYFDTLPPLLRLTIEPPDMREQELAYIGMVDKAQNLQTSLSSRRGKLYELFDQHLQHLNFLKQVQGKAAEGVA